MLGRRRSEPCRSIAEAIGAFAGRDLTVDVAVLESERDTATATGPSHTCCWRQGARFRSARGPRPLLPAVFRACRWARPVGHCGHPRQRRRQPADRRRRRVMSSVRAVLSVMATCGMYDGAGDWLYTVGLPAKSGVRAGSWPSCPGQLGIGIFSPPLDPHGNSVRGIAVCRDLVQDPISTLSGEAGRAWDRSGLAIPLAQIALERHRDNDRGEPDLLGPPPRVRELQGELNFLAAEAATRGLEADGQPRWVVLELRHVKGVDRGAAILIADLVMDLRAAGLVSLYYRRRRFHRGGRHHRRHPGHRRFRSDPDVPRHRSGPGVVRGARPGAPSRRRGARRPGQPRQPRTASRR